jgi:Protein phosphatase 2C
MTGSEEPAKEGAATTPWSLHPNGRWVIGDAGRQPEVVPVPSTLLASTRPDIIIDGGRIGGLVYRATSQRGFGHQESGTPRQDAYVARPTRDDRWLLGCVADGVSEGRRSHEAADLVCRNMTGVLASALDELPAEVDAETWPQVAAELPWQRAVDEASTAVREAATVAVHLAYERRNDRAGLARLAERPLTESEARTVMSSTVTAFAVRTYPDRDGTFPAAVSAVGDSSALLLSDGGWQPLTGIKNTDTAIASSAVQPLPGNVTVQPIARHLRRGEALVVITDGLGDPLGAGAGVVGRFLAAMWAEPPDLLAFAGHTGFYRRTFADDRTAVVVWADPDG